MGRRMLVRTPLTIALVIAAFAAGSVMAAVYAQGGGADGSEAEAAAGTAVCHVPAGNSAKAHTIVVDADELAEHLDHGDALGACGDGDGDATATAGEADGDGDKVTLCHTPEDNPDNAHTIGVGADAVSDHQDHGDALGPCASDDVQTTADGHQHGQRPHSGHPGYGRGHTKHHDADGVSANGTGDDTPADRIAVCHKGQTKHISPDALADHLAHGDAEGACP